MIYLDNNATTRPLPEVTEVMSEMLTDYWGNPSSVHRYGQMTRQRLELARQQVTEFIGSSDKQLIFTSGGTESNNMALNGILKNPRFNQYDKYLVTSPLEHAAIREPSERAAKEQFISVINVHSESGLITGSSLNRALEELLNDANDSPILILLSLQWANNETGIIQPMADYAGIVEAFRERLQERNNGSILVWHSDATQAAGKLPVDCNNILTADNGHPERSYPIDLLTIAAHKFHGPKGAGALHVRTGVPLYASQLGGPQERERRGGTENTPAIIGMGVASEKARQFLQSGRAEQISQLRDQFEAQLKQLVPEAQILGKDVNRLWNTSNIAFPHLEAEAILLSLSERGVFASAGAACSSGSLEPSPVLLAMGIPEHLAHGAIRFSLSRDTKSEEIEQALFMIPGVIHRLQKTLPR